MPIKSNKFIKKDSITPSNEDIELNKKEIQFLLAKMKTAQFIGAEFEQFYSIFTKLSKQLKK
jgi:hypothetical protein